MEDTNLFSVAKHHGGLLYFKREWQEDAEVIKINSMQYQDMCYKLVLHMVNGAKQTSRTVYRPHLQSFIIY